MTNQHPITPPPELVQQLLPWIGDYYGCPVSGELAGVETAIATRAAQWGADQELEACCEEIIRIFDDEKIVSVHDFIQHLRAARRPKPPSLKEQALDELHISFDRGYLKKEAADTIRHALEQLDD